MRTPAVAKTNAKIQIKAFGWQDSQWDCLEQLWTAESNWRPNAKNRQPVHIIKNGKRIKLYAGGIPQILGLNPKINVAQQVQLGLAYIQRRYSSPCRAMEFHKKHNWY